MAAVIVSSGRKLSSVHRSAQGQAGADMAQGGRRSRTRDARASGYALTPQAIAPSTPGTWAGTPPPRRGQYNTSSSAHRCALSRDFAQRAPLGHAR